MNDEIILIGKQLLSNLLNRPSSVSRCVEITKEKGLTKKYWWQNNVYAGLSMHSLSYEGLERNAKFIGIEPCTKEFYDAWRVLTEDEKDQITAIICSDIKD